MLIQFVVENFLSFKDGTVFSMVAPPQETRGVVEVPTHGLRLMRIAAFYGANASGKSNLVEAMRTACLLIAREQPSEAQLPDWAFRLRPESASKPTRFQFDFIVGDARYTYILIFDTNTIHAEALYRRIAGSSTEEIIWEREAPADGGEHQITLGPLFNTYNEENRQFAKFTARVAHPRQPWLWKFATSNVPEIAATFAPIREWFRDGLMPIAAASNYRNLVRELHGNDAFRRFYAKMLSTMGTGVQDVIVEKDSDERVSQFMRDYDEVIKEPKAKEIIDSLARSNREVAGIAIDADGSLLALKLAHITRTGTRVLFSLEDESDGTRRLLHLLPVLFHRTQISGQCTVIDELDRSLHTALTRHFIEEFLSMGSGTQTQLIFTTHDTNLLNGRLLPISAIWFVEKDDDGASHIHSLAEYDPEQIEQLLEHLEKGYLQGRFGAIPFITDPNNLRWSVRKEKLPT